MKRKVAKLVGFTILLKMIRAYVKAKPVEDIKDIQRIGLVSHIGNRKKKKRKGSKMDNDEKIINEFESQVKSFTPACTSDERFKECCESVLELLKDQNAEKKYYCDCEYYGACHAE